MMVMNGTGSSPPSSLRLLRVSPGSVVQCCLQRPDPTWLSTHWLSNHQIPCIGGDNECPACMYQLARSTGFVVVTIVQGNKPVPMLLEVTPHAWSSLRMSSQFENQTIVGGRIVALSRKYKNSPMRMEVTEHVSRVFEECASEERVLRALATLFQLPVCLDLELLRSKSSPWLEILRNKLFVAVSKL